MPGFEARQFGQQEQVNFREYPAKHLEYRKVIEQTSNAIFPLFLQDSEAQRNAFQVFRDGMKDDITDPSLKDKLVPKWSVGCRRLTPGVGYLNALSDPKSSVVYGEISKITEKGPVTADGREHPVDVLICATGFDTTFKPRFPLVGPDGSTLAEKWEVEPSSYLGMAAAGFPNYFMFLVRSGWVKPLNGRLRHLRGAQTF